MRRRIVSKTIRLLLRGTPPADGSSLDEKRSHWRAGAIARSVDDGASWSAPLALSGGAGPSIASNGGDTLVVTWSGGIRIVYTRPFNGSRRDMVRSASDRKLGQRLQPRCYRWRVYGGCVADVDPVDYYVVFSRSVDDGVTWSAPGVLPPGGDSDGESADGIRLATDRLGTWLAVWRAPLTGSGFREAATTAQHGPQMCQSTVRPKHPGGA